MEKSVYTREYRVLLQLLREMREEAGLTQTELAQRLDESQVFVSRFERAESRLDAVQLRTICMALGTTLPKFARRYERRLESAE